MPNDAETIARLDLVRGMTGEGVAEGATEQEHTEAAEWPVPFFETTKGIWFQQSPHAKDGKPEPSAIWVCAPFAVMAETADEAGGS